MYELLVEDYFSAAHRLKFYQGSCEKLHGHNWKVQVYIESGELDNIGLVMDFKDIKKEIRKLFEIIDHADLNSLKEFDGMNPSSENISRWIYKKLTEALEDRNVKVKKVRVWESVNAAAAYYE